MQQQRGGPRTAGSGDYYQHESVGPEPENLGLGRSIKTSSSALTASSLSGDNRQTSFQHFYQLRGVSSGEGGPRPPASASSSERRTSGAWDRNPQPIPHPAVLATAASVTRGSVDAVTVDDHSSGTSQHHWPRSESDESSDEQSPNYRPLDIRGVGKPSASRTAKVSKGFFRSLIRKFTKTSKRYGYVPNTAEEKDRNVLQHQIIYDLFDGRLHLSPLSKVPKRVLDVGTGPGLWALRGASSKAGRNSSSSVLGIDINEVRPPYTLPNCRFEVMDVTEEWSFGDDNFDFIHIRMLGDLTHKTRLVQSIYDNLNPGGWVEFTEWIVQLQSPNHSLDGSAFRRWNCLLRQGLRNLGSSLYYPNEYKPLLRKAGFENIHETRNGALTNPCYPGRRLQKVGAMMTTNWRTILEPLTMPVFTNALGWTEDEVRALCKEVNREIGDTRYHSFMTLLTVCARKPSDGTSSASASISSAHKYPPAPSFAASSSTSQSEHLDQLKAQ